MAKYLWKPGARIGIPAQPAGEAIDGLRKQADGVVRPEEVLDSARKRNSPLHAAFEWRDGVAAEKWRRHQAVHLLNCLMVIVKTEKDGAEQVRPYRAYVVVQEQGAEDDGQVYVYTTDALKNPGQREQILARALKDHEVWERRYHDMEELAAIIRVAQETRRRLR